jgi:hypothetical protein
MNCLAKRLLVVSPQRIFYLANFTSKVFAIELKLSRGIETVL